jgi:CheY-like chemotaxis protein
MAKRLALVVDDSKTARVTLKRMLEKQDLDVDTRESAQEALDYLVSNTPDVIFMDHMMPGMDGFEAVEAIKNNPDTATIPIMMYTSKGGDLYVGQARALGAVGILPKEVQPAELFQVLNKLGLVRDRRSKAPPADNRFMLIQPPNEVTARADTGNMEEIARRAAESVAASNELHGRMGEQLSEHFSELRQDIGQLRDSLERLANSPAGRQPGLRRVRQSGLFIPLVVLLVMLIPLVWLQKINSETQLKLDIARNQALRLQSTLDEMDENNAGAGQAAALPESAPDAGLDGEQRAQLFATLAWAVNLGGIVDTREEAFGDRRLAIVYELVSRLHALGFRGVVRLESHLGEFCLAGDDAEGYTLAPGDMPAYECSRYAHPLEDVPLIGERQSIAFANFLATSPLINDGNIRVEIVSHRYDKPHLKYPSQNSGISAREWNRIAAANNRVDVTLIPAQ